MASTETGDVRLVMHDVLALSTLSTVWMDCTPHAVADSLADALMRMLRLDLILIHLPQTADRQACDITRSSGEWEAAARRADVSQALATLLHTRTDVPPAVPDPLGHHTQRITTAPIGIAGELGTVVLGSTSAGFPTEADQLLLRIASNQATVALQSAKVLAERERLTFLAEASHLFSRTLESKTILRILARAAVPWLADWCAVDVLDEDGKSLRPLAVQHVDDRKTDLVREFYRTNRAGWDGVVSRLLAARRPELTQDITDVELAART
jgi:GAF domain-containing protein